MSKYSKISASVLAFLLLAGTAVPSIADDLEDQLADIQSQISAAQEEQASAQEIINAVVGRLEAIQQELDAANAELARIRAEQARLAEQIRQNEIALQKAIDDLHRRQDILGKRVRSIYMHGQLNYVDVIVGSNSFSDFANRLELLKRIIRADFSLILEIQDKQREIEAQKAQLEQEKAQVDVLEENARQAQSRIEAKKAEQQQALEEAQQHRDAAEQSERELREASAAVEAKIQARLREQQSGGYTNSVVGSGQLGWPCSGPITSPFGYRVHPIFGIEISHAGIDIGVPEGTPVQAADSGTVIEADWISGYGNTVIIDHGNGIQTLYAHNSGFAASYGQAVSKGEVIAYSGQTGNVTGPHCHFEVRINGSPVDPMGYL